MNGEVRAIRYSDVLDAPNAQELLAEYAAECLLPDAAPQRDLYAAMENAGTLQVFGFYAGDELAGFASVISTRMPHHGKAVSTVESIFVPAQFRKSAAGNRLMDACEKYAEENGSICLTYTPRVESVMSKVLEHRANCSLSHAVYTRWFR